MDGNAVESLAGELLAALPKGTSAVDKEPSTEALIAYLRAADEPGFRATAREYLAAQIEERISRSGLAAK